MKRDALRKLVAGREVILFFLLILVAKAPLVCVEVDLFDAAAIEADPVLRGEVGVGEAFLFGSPAGAPDTRWRPLATASLASDLALGGGMLVVRLGNLLLHLGLMIALFRLLRRFGLAAWPAALSCLLLSLHPLQVPVIATIAGRAPLLGLLGFLLAALFATREAAGRLDRLAAASFAALATAAAPGCAALALFPLCAAWAHDRPLREGWRRATPMLWATGLVLLTAFLLSGRLGLAPAGRLVDGRGLGGVIAASLAAIGGPYPALILQPSAATPDPAAPGTAALGGGHAVVGALVLIALLLFAWRARLRGRSLRALGLLLAPALLLPATPLLANGPLPAPAEALPLLTVLVFPIAQLLAIPMLAPSRRTKLLLGLIVFGLSLFSLLRCWPWHDQDLLLDSLPTEGPLASIARADAEAANFAAPAPARAVEREIVAAALTRHPGEPRLLQERLRIELSPAGDLALADEAASALRADPRELPGLAGLLGTFAAARGRMDEARASWARGLGDPFDALARFFLAQDAQRAGDEALAKRLYIEALGSLRGPADQVLAHQILHQLDYMRGQGSIARSTLTALARRQLLYAPRPADRESLEAFLVRLAAAAVD